MMNKHTPQNCGVNKNKEKDNEKYGINTYDTRNKRKPVPDKR